MNRVIIICIFMIMQQAAIAQNIDKEGHRGCRGLMPENTIPAMLKALDLGVTTLEMDAVITKDKRVIISHEPFFNHEISTKPDGSYIDEKDEKQYKIFNMTYAETQQFDVGLKAHPRFPQQAKLAARKPLLSDVIDSAEQHAKATNRPLPYYNIETKCTPKTDNVFHPEPKEFTDLILSIIFEKKIQDRVIIQSFDVRSLQYLHQIHPEIRTALLVDNKDGLEKNLKRLGFTPSIYSPEDILVNEILVKECHTQNIKVLPWTVNTKEGINRLIEMGVDGIISDYPNLF